MTRWMLVLTLAAMLPAGVAWAANADAPKAEPGVKAVRQADPDDVDPNLVKGEDWTFDFQFSHPEPIVVQEADGRRAVYWYVLYTVANPTDEAKMYVPSFLLVTDTAKVCRAGLYPKAYEAIKMTRDVRFLENAGRLHGKIHPGIDNARTGVAIFAPIDREADSFRIIVEGISGQYIERPAPGTALAEAALGAPAGAAAQTAEGEAAGEAEAAPAEAPTPKAEPVILRKALVLTYTLPGDKWWLNLDQVTFVSKHWTWR